MGTSKAEGKRSLKEMEEYDQEEEEEDEDNTGTAAAETLGFEDDDVERKKKGKAAAGGSSSAAVVVSCQAHNCGADMTDAKRYHRRHKVCEHHAKAPFVVVAGVHQRFCQQCSRFHELSEFDDNKRSCRRRLAGHNERRRKNSYDYHGEASI